MAAPVLGKLALDGNAEAAPPRTPQGHIHGQVHMGHAAMLGGQAPAVGGPHDLHELLYPPEALPYEPGRVREYSMRAFDREIEIAPGVFFPAWTYNGTVPGPVIRATEGDTPARPLRQRRARTRTRSTSTASIPSDMDGVFEVVKSGDEFIYEFPARPAGMHLYHCHTTPLKKHIHKGLYGAFIIDPKEPRPPAQELVMVMNGYDTDGDGGNNFYTVNGRSFYYAKYPIVVKRGTTVRIYLVEPDRVRPDQLVPPARRVLPLPADRHGRPLGVHRHGDALPGPARRDRDRLPQHRHVHVPRAPVASSPISAGWASSRSID